MVSTMNVAQQHILVLPARPMETEWPVNQECITQFLDWLSEGGYAKASVRTTYKTMARLALENLPRPYWAVEPDEIIRLARLALERRDDLQPQTKKFHASALEKLRKFFLLQRGQVFSAADPLKLPEELATLPDWVRTPLRRYLRLKQRNWRARSVQRQTRQLFRGLQRMVGFFIEQHAFNNWEQLSLGWVEDYIDARLRQGLAPATINWDLSTLRMFCHFLLDEGYDVSPAVTRMKLLDMPRRLPRPLPDEHVRRLEKCIHSAIEDAASDYRRQQAIMDLAWFYLLWHCGLRLGEVRALRLDDLDLENRKLLIRDSKERKDRVVYLSDATVMALRQHLDTRSDRNAAHVFTCHHAVPSSQTFQNRLARYGKQCEVSVTPHRLRHTFASQMLAAGMPVTSLQRYLGHEELDTTMVYAKVSDPMLQQDYYRGIAAIDPSSAELAPPLLTPSNQAELRRLIEELRTPGLAPSRREAILEQMQRMIDESG